MAVVLAGLGEIEGAVHKEEPLLLDGEVQVRQVGEGAHAVVVSEEGGRQGGLEHAAIEERGAVLHAQAALIVERGQQQVVLGLGVQGDRGAVRLEGVREGPLHQLHDALLDGAAREAGGLGQVRQQRLEGVVVQVAHAVGLGEGGGVVGGEGRRLAGDGAEEVHSGVVREGGGEVDEGRARGRHVGGIGGLEGEAHAEDTVPGAVVVGLEDDQEGVGGRGARLELVGEGAEVAGLAGDVGGGEVGEVLEAGVGVADEEVDVAVEGVGPGVLALVLELGDPHLGGGVGAGAELVEHGAGVAVAAGTHLLAEDGLAAEPALADPRLVVVVGEGVEVSDGVVLVPVVGGEPDLVAVREHGAMHPVDGVVHHLEEVVVGVAARQGGGGPVGGAIVAPALEEGRVLGGAVAEVDDVDLGEGLDEDG